ncbi:helix-turn-helix transcriptional regulator [Tepidibacter thalassicus]|uniref:Putative transcriptional regulator n=1 Tax=Tepidibacter thalassicus DSM 15285 TaxID=1123350 RepID=A0A1M5PXN8_9FIRM|nr:helix-turn-helix transcriptional regulator [Tepidibacter thalassicus]SHH06466.1 putative transcriptional regulator [Tepidibacter thalassicus DSM 15285]
MKRELLQKLRKKNNLTQQEVAEILEITPVFYGMIERGERNPSLELAKKIADLFDSTIDEIFFNTKLYKLYNGQSTA